MPRSQQRLAFVLLGFVSLVVAVWGVCVDRVQGRAELEREVERLAGEARAVALLLDGVRLHEFETARLDAIADRAGAQLGLRVTIIGADGALLGDSDIGLARLPVLGSFAERPEVAAALAGEWGRSARRSENVGREFLYSAVPVRGAVVRLGMPMEQLEALSAARRRSYLAAALVASLVAVGLAGLISGLAIRPLREMQRVAASIAQGRLEDRLPFGEGTELADIAGSINRMAAQLRARLSEANREKEQLEAVLESMLEGVLVLDEAGVVLLANSRVRDFYDVRSELVGRPLLECVRDAQLERLLGEAAASDEIVSQEISVGTPVPRTLRVQAVRFPAQGERIGTVAVLHDVSELARLEEVRRDFVANASHELRTPLSAIRGFAETLIGSQELRENQRSQVKIIERNAVRLGNIVRDLLELSAIESRKQPLELASVDLQDIARRLVREYASRARDRKIELRLEGCDDARVRADAAAVEQVLVNLVDNALKYTDEGGSVILGVEPRNGRLRVSVTDTGIGIPEKEQSRIFERFYRVDKARSRALGGTGLGLAIAKHLVQNMNGEMFVTSEVGGGSTFAFTLPRVEAGADSARGPARIQPHPGPGAGSD